MSLLWERSGRESWHCLRLWNVKPRASQAAALIPGLSPALLCLEDGLMAFDHGLHRAEIGAVLPREETEGGHL